MISGNNYWNYSIKKGMKPKRINKNAYLTYEETKENMYQILKENANKSPNEIGVVDTNEIAYTYSQMLDMTDELSYYLVDKYKIKRGNHVGVLLYNSIEFIITFLASQKIGAIIIPIPTKFKKPEINSLIQKSDCDLIIVDKDYSGWISSDVTCNFLVCESKSHTNYYAFQFLNELPVGEIGEKGFIGDKAVIMYTSGTTSSSKGAVIRNFNIQHAITSYERILNVGKTDSTVLAIPIYNVTGLIATLSLFLKCQGKVYLHKFFDVHNLLSDIKRLKISFLHASPTVFTLMLNERESYQKLQSIKMLACGSSNMPIGKIQELKDWLPQITFKTIYGLTETSSPATIFPNDASESKYIGSSGHPIPGLSIKITNEYNYEVGTDEVGEIWLKGANVIENYYNIYSEEITKDGWLNTGDIGYLNEEGFLYIIDRKKDLINRGGEKVSSFEIENAISQIDGIKEVAVIGKKDEKYGEIPLAFLSVDKQYKISEKLIRENLKSELAGYKIPKHYKFMNEILKTANGKIDKLALRALINNKENDLNE